MEAIRLFCDVARMRSFSRGAELNGITQSAASQRIRALEQELGVELIDRSYRPLRLTEAGRIFYRGCRKILAQYEALRREVTDVSKPLRGRVSVAAIYSADIRLLTEIRETFERQHPGTQVEIRFLQPDAVYEQVRTDLVDFGILSYPDRWRGMEAVKWRDEAMVLACRAGHELADRAGPLHPSIVAGYELVSYEPNLPIAREILAYLRRNGVDPRIVSTFDNVDTIKTCLLSTDAVALLPERVVRSEEERGILATFRLQPTLIRPVGIIYPRDRGLTPPVKSFLDFLIHYELSGLEPTIGPALAVAH